MELSTGTRGELDAQRINVLATWMLEHPSSDDEEDPSPTPSATTIQSTVCPPNQSITTQPLLVTTAETPPSERDEELTEGIGRRVGPFERPPSRLERYRAVADLSSLATAMVRRPTRPTCK